MFIINKIATIANILVAVLLLGSYLSPSVSPVTVWPVAFLGLGYIALLAVNIVFVIYWLVQMRLHVFISIGAIVLGFSYTGRFLQLKGKEPGKNQKTIKVMSFNIQNFDERHRDVSPYLRFFEYIKTEKPDLLCMQEFNRWVPMPTESNTYNELKKAFGGKMYYVSRDSGLNDLTIVSRHRIIKHKSISFSKLRTNNGGIWADIVIAKDTFRVFSVHYQSYLLSNMNLGGFGSPDKALKNSKNIVLRLKSAFKYRVPQVEIVLQEIEQSPYKVILCGDFNDTPMSFTYGQMTNKLKDAFVESGSGIPTTYSGPYPSYRIDYIMHDTRLKSYNYQRCDAFGSDHHMVQAQIGLEN